MLAVDADGIDWIFFFSCLTYIFLSSSLLEMARYREKTLSQTGVSPKQPTYQPTKIFETDWINSNRSADSLLTNVSKTESASSSFICAFHSFIYILPLKGSYFRFWFIGSKKLHGPSLLADRPILFSAL